MSWNSTRISAWGPWSKAREPWENDRLSLSLFLSSVLINHFILDTTLVLVGERTRFEAEREDGEKYETTTYSDSPNLKSDRKNTQM